MKNKTLILSQFYFWDVKSKNLMNFDFSYGNTFETDFSVKFQSKNDSIFLYENWASDNTEIPKSKTNYFSTPNKSQRSKLDSFISNIDFKNLDTLYFENYKDGEYFNFLLEKVRSGKS